MPLFSRLRSLDADFHNSPTPPVIINDLPARTEADREYFNNMIRQTFTTDMISMLPRCECPDDRGLKGEHLIGVICEECGTPVKESFEKDIQPNLWFRRPQGVEKLLSPIIWIMLTNRFSKSKYSIIQWLTDRTYRPAMKPPAIIERMKLLNIPRGYNHFVQNFDALMDWLFEQSDFKKTKTITNSIIDMLDIEDPDSDALRQLIRDNRDIIFSDYIPIPNRSLLVLDSSALGIYGEGSTFDMLNTLNTMLSIDKDFYDKSANTIENRTARIMAMMGSYYATIYNVNMSKKAALMRKNVYAGRGNFSFRAVITSHEELHDHDEIHIPWCIAVAIFQMMLVPTMMMGGVTKTGLQYKFTENEAVGHLYSHVYQYCPMLAELLDDLIAKSPGNYISVTIQRN